MTIARVEQLIDGYVEVFDENNNHMPEYEGHAREAMPKILKAGWRGPATIVGRRKGETQWPKPPKR